MKNKIAIASAFIAASSFSTAEIVINDFLSFEGFVDMSYVHSDAEVENESESENSFAIDQVEISWLFDFETVTAQIDIAYEGTDGDYEQVEQAFATYHMSDGGSITAGRFASMLGFEAFEPTGLYQYSTAYDGGLVAEEVNSALDQELVDLGWSSAEIATLRGILPGLPGYNQGVKYTYETDAAFFGVSVLDGNYDRSRLGGDTNDDGVSGQAFELAAAYDFGNGFAAFGGFRLDDGDVADTTTFNTYATYESGAWLFAAEYVFSELDIDQNFADANTSGLSEVTINNALLMANYAYSDQASVTGRISYSDQEIGNDVEADWLKYTLAHGYAITDNLLLVTEISFIDGDIEFGGESEDFDGLEAAVELLFTF